MEVGAVSMLLGLLVRIAEDLIQVVESVGVYISARVSSSLKITARFDSQSEIGKRHEQCCNVLYR